MMYTLILTVIPLLLQIKEYQNLISSYRRQEKDNGSKKKGEGESLKDLVLVLDGVTFSNYQGGAFESEAEVFNVIKAVRGWLKGEIRRNGGVVSLDPEFVKTILSEAEMEAPLWDLLKKEFRGMLMTWIAYQVDTPELWHRALE